MFSLLNSLAYFFIYSFLGWLMEIICCSYKTKKIEKRGFLNGPYCPIYGIGCLLVLSGCFKFVGNPFYVFLLSIIICSGLELFSGCLLEDLFNKRWWDYANHKYNILGFVCLKNAVCFGILSLFVVYYMQPFLMQGISRISNRFIYIVTAVCLLIFLVDLIVSYKNVKQN